MLLCVCHVGVYVSISVLMWMCDHGPSVHECVCWCLCGWYVCVCLYVCIHLSVCGWLFASLVVGDTAGTLWPTKAGRGG